MNSPTDTGVPPNPNEGQAAPAIARFIATAGGAGYSPAVPGTAGSLVGLVIYLLLPMSSPAVLGAVVLVTLFAGTWASSLMERAHGDDPPIVVIDEVVGMWISLLFLPKNLLLAGMAFIFFRVYDIIKPPPARRAEKLTHGWGIMVDDVVAGVYANLTIRLLATLIPSLIPG